ncbi:MAG TPA: diacylglycerol kinase family protein [Acidimicrobiales bacterium]|nr:diacylglycerol kinase family protein [Acidimicrobiales bacterium]
MSPPVTGVVLVNPKSGPLPDPLGEVREHFGGHEVVECSGEDLEERARTAIGSAPGFVAMAGGDGSVRCVASLLAGSETPLVPVPTGTRNHFARELGIQTVAEAAVAAVDGVRRRVDLAEVNGERFVNNASIGFYAALVRERHAHERRLPKALANATAAWAQARKGHRFAVKVDRRDYRAWLVFVGNGCYGEGIADLMNRDALDAAVLDVRVLRADAGLARTRMVLALLLGRIGRSPMIVQNELHEVEIGVERSAVEVALDGEVVRLRPPLRFTSLPGALAVLVPPDRPDR